ncbi:MAG: vWA domain-containing protein [Omnitrophica WOR_2 bacterium]
MEGSNFLPNLLLFGRLLRGLGLDVNPGRMMDLIHGLDFIDIGRRSDFYHAARTLLVHDQKDIPLFDQAFEMFWQDPQEGWMNLPAGGIIPNRRPKKLAVPPPLIETDSEKGKRDGDSPHKNGRTIFQITSTYSDRELLRRKDFSEMTGEELDAVKRLMRALSFRLGERRTRRLHPGKGQRLDLRRSLRLSYKTGGEVLVWALREPKFKPRPLVILADISGSMERYTRLLLHFIYGLAQSHNQPVEAFVFSTRLTRITRQLQDKDIERALRDISQVVHDWAGGTRTGESLKKFNYDWGRRVLGRGAVVLFISDGWDRGDVHQLGTEMARLHRSCHRLIWLNPLLGSPVYEPLTRGAQAVLPNIDDFLPVHNLASLEDLALHLEKISNRNMVH